MATRPDIDDDDFSEIYKEYTGPPGSVANNAQDSSKANKRSHAGSDEEEEPRDPNAVPTDFTSREAKGCPSTLGANRKSQDFFERIPARERHVKALFAERVIQRIEKDIGCKIKMEEKFIIVSGKDRLILAKGVDAVHKVIKGEVDQKGSSSSHKSRSRSPERSPVGSRLRRSESQRSYTGHSRDTSQYQQRFGRQDKIVEDRVREDLQKFSRGSPQAYGNDGGRSRSSHSKSPALPPYAGNSYGSYDGHNHSVGGYRNDGWDTERQGPDLQSGRQFENSTFPQMLEELELEYKREAMELGRIRDKEEDEENYKHREARQQMPTSGFGGYKQHTFSDYDGSSTNPHYPGAGLPMDLGARYPNHVENYASRPHDSYGSRSWSVMSNAQGRPSWVDGEQDKAIVKAQAHAIRYETQSSYLIYINNNASSGCFRQPIGHPILEFKLAWKLEISFPVIQNFYAIRVRANQGFTWDDGSFVSGERELEVDLESGGTTSEEDGINELVSANKQNKKLLNSVCCGPLSFDRLGNSSKFGEDADESVEFLLDKNSEGEQGRQQFPFMNKKIVEGKQKKRTLERLPSHPSLLKVHHWMLLTRNWCRKSLRLQ
ncbi:hypothetical protein GH714_004646 [Hevea brasiliensis]|uniref:Uncharacterized protein n=1 Tax=Hevea brasiliensis TaxID=3981 RepID=A0A6A6MA09_HEVBR|nr:hypothetical protein GH714_004646 [Hevea brasiliensis]